MDSFLLITIATLLASTDGLYQIQLPPTVIPGQYETCPPQDILEMARQRISARVDGLLSNPADCKEALDNGHNTNGVYRVQPDDLEPFDVYCDMETDGGGWTVFQRRQDGSEDFYRGWDDYVSGFGNLTGEFWLGLENIHRLTNRNITKLRVDLGDFDRNTAFAKYNTFQVLDSSTNYRLSVSDYSGTAGDTLASYHNGFQFTTKDRDNDPWGDNCAVAQSGAWWYVACILSNLNGLYRQRSQSYNCDRRGVIWERWHGYCTSLKFTEMKLQ